MAGRVKTSTATSRDETIITNEGFFDKQHGGKSSKRAIFADLYLPG
jgi:hypothetical protein